MGWKVSRYARMMPVDDETAVLYSGSSGAVVKLAGTACERTKVLLALAPRGRQLPAEAEQDPLFPHLAAGGFLVPAETDELELLQQEYETERRRAPFLLTVLPTFGCNLGCSYCFVGRKKGVMSRATQDWILEFVRRRLDQQGHTSLSVDWFGGEPLLALPVIERLSQAFLPMCQSRGVQYSAQVISNGTTLSRPVVERLLACGVKRLQITLDGPREVHDQRRPAKSGGWSSFDRVIEGLGQAFGKFQIRLRINIDRRNREGVWSLLELFDEKGWLGAETGFYPYLARVSCFTDACAGISSELCSQTEFHRLQFEWLRRLHAKGTPVPQQPLYHFPSPKPYNCGAVGPNAFIFSPDGEIHRCGLEADNPAEAVGRAGEALDANHPNARKWQEYSPFDDPVCRQCEFLPSCLGGCPRDRMKDRRLQIRETCRFHRQFENRILVEHFRLAQTK